MNEPKQRGMGCLSVLLSIVGVIVVLSCLTAWWKMRKERLSAQLLATVRSVQYRSEAHFSADQKAERAKAKQQTRKDEATVVRLLREGADPNVRDFIHVDRSLWDQTELLFKRIFKHPSAPDFLPQSALAMAIQSQDAVIVNALLKAGANDVNGQVEAQQAAVNLDALLNAAANDLNGHGKVQNDSQSPLLNYAASVGNLEVVKALCAHGADVHKIGMNSRGESLTLLQAVLSTNVGDTDTAILNTKSDASTERQNRSEIFHLLLAKGALYEPNSQEGFALLCEATSGGLLKPTRELLAAGVPPNPHADWPEDVSLGNPLNNGVMHDDLAMVKLLLQYGAQTRPARSEPPILLVSSPEMAKLLLEKGADPTVRVEGGVTAIRNARKNTTPSRANRIIALLKAYGAKR